MDNELIKITTNEKGQQCVSARELYEGLGYKLSSGNFTHWIEKQLTDVDAIENVDFTRFVFKNEGNNANIIDYVITVDIAKEICMIVGIAPRTNEETRKLSKKYRRYLIECEKKLKEVDPKAQLLLTIYNGGQEAVVATRELVELEKKPLLDKIEEQAPKVEYCDKILDPKDEENGFTKLITTTDIAKDLGMTARKLNKVLNDKGIIYKQGKVWKVYSEYEFLIKEKYCDYHITEYSQTLKWTEKGRKFIIETISNN